MNEQFYDVIGMDGELEALLRRCCRDAEIFHSAARAGIPPLDARLLATGLASNLRHLLDLMALRYGDLSAPSKDQQPLRVEDHVSPADVEVMRRAMRNIPRRAEQAIRDAAGAGPDWSPGRGECR